VKFGRRKDSSTPNRTKHHNHPNFTTYITLSRCSARAHTLPLSPWLLQSIPPLLSSHPVPLNEHNLRKITLPRSGLFKTHSGSVAVRPNEHLLVHPNPNLNLPRRAPKSHLHHQPRIPSRKTTKLPLAIYLLHMGLALPFLQLRLRKSRSRHCDIIPQCFRSVIVE